MARSKQWLAAAIGLVVLAAAGAAIVTTVGGEPASGSASELRLALLDQPAAASAVAEPLIPAAMRSGGYDVASARQAATLPDGSQVVAVRREQPELGGSLVCRLTVSRDGASQGGCARVQDFNSRGLIGTNGSVPDVDVVGLLPDGVGQVTVTFEDGSVRTVDVTDNAFVLHATHATRSVSFDGPNGLVTVDATPFRG